MECEIIKNLIRTIQDKRKNFIEQNGVFPNMIIMDRANQVLLNMHFINKIGTNMDTIYNMKILIDNSITRPEDIKLYYWSALERQDVEEKNYRKIRYDINHYEDIENRKREDKKIYFLKQDILKDINSIINGIKHEASFDEDMNCCCEDLTSEQCNDLIKSLKEIIRYLC